MPRITACLFIFFVSSCDYFQYSPHAFDLDESQTNLNAKNLLRLESNPADDTIRFVITGDSQLAIDELRDLVESVNSLRDVDFVFIAGDLTQKGTAKEYIWVQRELEELDVPYLAIVGNHDLERNGESLFKTMFGQLDYSFSYGNTKFICLNTNSYIYNNNGNIPDTDWLTQEMEVPEEVENVTIVSHIPPWWAPQFDPDLVPVYTNLLANNQKTLVSIHAHASSFFFGQLFRDDVDYLVVPSIMQDPTTPVDKSYVLAEIVGSVLIHEKVIY